MIFQEIFRKVICYFSDVLSSGEDFGVDFQIPRKILHRFQCSNHSGGGFSGFSDFLRSGGDFGVDFRIPRNFLIRNPPKIVQIGALGARIRPFYDPGRFFV